MDNGQWAMDGWARRQLSIDHFPFAIVHSEDLVRAGSLHPWEDTRIEGKEKSWRD
jgi:hypothetical protein